MLNTSLTASSLHSGPYALRRDPLMNILRTCPPTGAGIKATPDSAGSESRSSLGSEKYDEYGRSRWNGGLWRNTTLIRISSLRGSRSPFKPRASEGSAESHLTTAGRRYESREDGGKRRKFGHFGPKQQTALVWRTTHAVCFVSNKTLEVLGDSDRIAWLGVHW